MSTIYVFSSALNVFAIVICAIMIMRLMIHVPNPKAKLLFGISLVVQIISQSLSIYTYQFNVILRLQNAIWLCILASCFGQMFLNKSTIEMFSRLDPRITHIRVWRFYTVVIAIFTICSIPLLVYFLLDNVVLSIDLIANYSGMVVVIFTIIIDEVQGSFIAFLIFKRRRNLKSFEALVNTIFYLIIETLVDCMGVAAKMVDLSLPATEQNLILSKSLQQLAIGLGSIHFAISVHIFIQLKKLFLAGFIKKENSKPRVQNAETAKEKLDAGFSRNRILRGESGGLPLEPPEQLTSRGDAIV